MPDDSFSNFLARDMCRVYNYVKMYRIISEYT